MPSPFSGAMNYMARREALREQIRARMQAAQMAEQQRRDQLEALNLYRQQLMQWRGQQGNIAQQKFSQKQAEDKAWVNRLLGMKDEEVDPPVRAMLHATQAMVRANPDDPGLAAIAQDFVKSKSKPAANKLVPFMTTDPSGMTYQSYAVASPRGGMTMTPAGGSILSRSPTFGLGGTAPTPAAKDPDADAINKLNAEVYGGP